jgi:hypothetical protein
MHLGLNWQALCAPCSVLGYRSPVPLAKSQMAPMPSTLVSSGSKKKEPRYACLSGANISNSHRMWTEVSSSVPHFLQMRSLHSPMMCKCFLKVLCPVSRPITTLDYVLLKDNNWAPIAGSGPEINSRACLCVLQGKVKSSFFFFRAWSMCPRCTAAYRLIVWPLTPPMV